MLTYTNTWDAIDTIAKQNDLKASSLAVKAGLDKTTFNKSKRYNAQGKPRWVSLSSIQKILEVTNMSFQDFAALVENNKNT